MSRDLTMLIAHPDDEALFLWPFLDRTKRIICASNDSNNPEREWCRERGRCLEEVGQLIGADIVQLPYDSEFYRLPTRDGQLKTLAETILRHLADAETVFTHNAWGEYGNIDHILMHHVARVWQAETRRELLVSDIATEINWLPIRAWHEGGVTIGSDGIKPWGIRPGNSIYHEIDRPLFDRIKQVYDDRGCWTWAWEPVERCRVYSL